MAGFESAEAQGLSVADPAAVLAAVNAGAGSPFLRSGYVWAPNVDGWTIPEDPLAMYESGRQHDGPLIVGMNGNEGSLMTRGLPMAGAEGFAEHVRSVYPGQADEMLAHYDVTSADEAQSGIDHLVHDMYFAGPVRAHARSQAALSSPVWLYHFTHEPPTAWGESLGPIMPPNSCMCSVRWPRPTRRASGHSV